MQIRKSSENGGNSSTRSRTSSIFSSTGCKITSLISSPTLYSGSNVGTGDIGNSSINGILTNLNEHRKESECSGVTLSNLKLDLFHTNEEEEAVEDIINNNGENNKKSERKGSDVSAFTVTETMLLDTSTTAIPMKKRKESDISGMSGSSTMAGATSGLLSNHDIDYKISSRKGSDTSAVSTLMSIRKNSDASALSALIRDHEEEMMRHDTLKTSNSHVGASSRKESFSGYEGSQNGSVIDPFENLRKLSDASTAASLELQRASKSAAMVLGNASGCASANLIGLGDMRIKLDPTKDDASIATFENPSGGFILQPAEPFSIRAANNNAIKSQPCENTALDHLDALCHRKDQSDEGSTGSVTINEANQKILVDALLGPNSKRNRAESWGGISDISHNAELMAATMPRGPSPQPVDLMSPGSFGYLNHDNIPIKINVPGNGSRERSESFSSIAQREKILRQKRKDSIDLKVLSRDRSDSFRVDRDRNESFDLKAFTKDCYDSFLTCERSDSFATRDRVDSFITRDRSESFITRKRFDSVATEKIDAIFTRERHDSFANLSGVFSKSKGRDRLGSLDSLGEVSMSMPVGEYEVLKDLAGNLEQIEKGEDSSMADSDSCVSTANSNSQNRHVQKNNLPAPTIQVDSEAVQAAVLAAMAATEDFMSIKATTKPANVASSNLNHDSTLQHPLPPVTVTSSQATCDEMEAIRARARAAAGYVHPDNGGPQPAPSKPKPMKKRPAFNSTLPPMKRPKLPMSYATPQPDRYISSSKAPSGAFIYSNINSVTPKRQNYSSTIKTNISTPSSSMSKGGQSNQKWDEMFDCLVSYVKEEKEKSTKGLSDEEITNWEWSGNVPTNYKTQDNKALGRWINNQRSAKSKDNLKPEREVKLVSTGLKWSVLTTNAWEVMFKELKIYVAEKVCPQRIMF